MGRIIHEVRRFEFGDLQLQSGSSLRDGFLTYSTHGKINCARSNAVLVLPSLMGDLTRHDFLIGAGNALDPGELFIITADTLGNGKSVSPSNSKQQWGADFPRFTIMDMVRAQHRLIEEVFGIRQLLAVAGLSMGGMQALQWAVALPSLMKAVVPIITMARATPWVSAYWHAMRLSLKNVEGCDDGPDSRESLRRAIFHFLIMTRHWNWYQRTFDKDPDTLYEWMDEEARRISSLWHPLDFIYQTLAEDDYDLAATLTDGAGFEAALASIQAKVLLMPSATDILHPASELHLAARFIRQVRVVEIPSSCGHLGGGGLDPRDVALMNRVIRAFLREVRDDVKTR